MSADLEYQAAVRRLVAAGAPTTAPEWAELGRRFGHDRIYPGDEPIDGPRRDGPPIREVHIDVTPIETREELIRRATRELTGAWDTVVAEAEAAGWVWPDTAPNEERDLDWLYLHLRGRSWGAIAAGGPSDAAGYLPTDDKVKKAVKAIAARAGVVLARDS